MSNFIDLRRYASNSNFWNNSTLQDKYGILRQSRFVCLLNAPEKLAGQFKDLKGNGWLEWQVLAVSCPDVMISTQEMEINGWPRYYLETRRDADLSITFMESSNLIVRTFFYAWMNAGYNQIKMHRNYIEDVEAKEMKIIPITHDNRGVRADVFRGVFPYQINNLDYNMESGEGILKTEVKFKYLFHTLENINSSEEDHEILK